MNVQNKISHCPICGNNEIIYWFGNTYHCEHCHENFDETDCDFCSECGKQIELSNDNVMDEDGNKFCTIECRKKFYKE